VNDPLRKVAIVTGGATGIGRAISLALADDGFAIAVNHLPEVAEAAGAIAAEVATTDGTAITVEADVSDVVQLSRMFDDVESELGGLDVLVNNAAWAITKPIADVTEEEFDRLVAVNLKGVFFACQQAAHRMRDGGSIVNISSSTTGLAFLGYGAYDASKGGVEQITRILARELGHRGIRVNTVSPGATDTEQFRRGKSVELIAELERMSVFGRLGKPEEIAAVVALLVGEAGRWVTGQNIRVNGGTV
jgi:3-oxoacyl-[acyl-carrier protein] reductase